MSGIKNNLASLQRNLLKLYWAHILRNEIECFELGDQKVFFDKYDFSKQTNFIFAQKTFDVTMKDRHFWVKIKAITIT